MPGDPEKVEIWPERYPFPIGIDVAARRTREAGKLFKYHEEFFDLLKWENREVIKTVLLVGHLLEMDDSMQANLFSGIVASYFVAFDQLLGEKYHMPVIGEVIMLKYIGKLAEKGSRDDMREYFQRRAIEIKGTDCFGWTALENIRKYRNCGEEFNIGAVIIYDLMDEWKNGSVDMDVWGPTIQEAVPDNF